MVFIVLPTFIIYISHRPLHIYRDIRNDVYELIWKDRVWRENTYNSNGRYKEI